MTLVSAAYNLGAVIGPTIGGTLANQFGLKTVYQVAAVVLVFSTLIILFALYTEPWYLTLNREFIAEEVVRALVGSLGLLLAVPLTTLIAALVARLDSASAAS